MNRIKNGLPQKGAEIAKKCRFFAFLGVLSRPTVLDPFEGDFVPDGKLETKPLVIANGSGGLPSAQCRSAPGKFGKGLAFFSEGERK